MHVKMINPPPKKVPVIKTHSVYLYLPPKTRGVSKLSECKQTTAPKEKIPAANTLHLR